MNEQERAALRDLADRCRGDSYCGFVAEEIDELLAASSTNDPTDSSSEDGGGA